MADNIIKFNATKRGRDEEASDGDLEAAEQELRVRAKNLCRQVETTYWELGQALYEIFDGLPGGFRDSMKGEGAKGARVELFRKWGYESFEEYCEREIKMQRRSASNIRYAYYWFQIELDLPVDVITRLKALGRSKVYLLAGFAQKDNIVPWLEKAETMTHDELKKVIRAARAVNKPSSDETFENAKKAAQEREDGHAIAPAPETAHTLHTSLYDGQWDTWNAALERAKNVTGSDKISHNLEMICTDYLANNDFADPKDDLKRSIAKFEKLTGVKLIAIDTKSGKPIYGGDLLWLMVKERVDFDKAESEKTEDKNQIKEDGEPGPSF